MPEEEMEKYGLKMIAKGVEQDPYDTIMTNLHRTSPEAVPLVEMILQQNKLLEQRVAQTEALIMELTTPKPTPIPLEEEESDEYPVVTGYRGTTPVEVGPKYLVTVLRTDGADQGYFHKELCVGILLQVSGITYFIPNGRRVYVPAIVREVLEQRDKDLEAVYAGQAMLNGQHEYGTIRLGR